MSTHLEEQTMYMTHLLCETLPASYKTYDNLKSLELDPTGPFIVLQIILSNDLRLTICSIKDEELTAWKNNFHELIYNAFSSDTLSTVALLNLQPFSRTVIIKVCPFENSSPTFNSLSEAFHNLCEQLETLYQSSIIGCFGKFTTNLLDIGLSYKNALLLQDYSLIIGLSNCLFADQVDLSINLSLTEYKYINLFDDLFEKQDWFNLYELLNRIKDTLIQQFINNSKTTYIYKELFGIAIRKLFDDMNAHKESIQKLNEGIQMFKYLFDDIYSVHSYYISILKEITQTDISYTHPAINKALNIIHTQYMEPISLNSLTDELNLSIAYFSRLFKEEMNTNFKAYLTEYRMTQSKSLLINSNSDIEFVARSIGYHTATQMVRVFKTHEGMTPTEYRRLNK